MICPVMNIDWPTLKWSGQMVTIAECISASYNQSVLLWIQAAQEREELQRKGDEYDSKIRKAEKEIR